MMHCQSLPATLRKSELAFVLATGSSLLLANLPIALAEPSFLMPYHGGTYTVLMEPNGLDGVVPSPPGVLAPGATLGPVEFTDAHITEDDPAARWEIEIHNPPGSADATFNLTLSFPGARGGSVSGTLLLGSGTVEGNSVIFGIKWSDEPETGTWTLTATRGAGLPGDITIHTATLEYEAETGAMPGDVDATFAGFPTFGAWMPGVVTPAASTLVLTLAPADGLPDCDDDGVPDVIEITASGDCNENGIPDDCDIDFGTSIDADGDGTPDECECPADLTGDGVVNGFDLGMLLGAFTGTAFYAGCPSMMASADLNGDCMINGLDLAIVLAAWGPC